MVLSTHTYVGVVALFNIPCLVQTSCGFRQAQHVLWPGAQSCSAEKMSFRLPSCCRYSDLLEQELQVKFRVEALGCRVSPASGVNYILCFAGTLLREACLREAAQQSSDGQGQPPESSSTNMHASAAGLTGLSRWGRMGDMTASARKLSESITSDKSQLSLATPGHAFGLVTRAPLL